VIKNRKLSRSTVREDPARRFFAQDLSDRERAAFEAGIALATLYHQFIGAPLPSTRRGVRALERAMEEAVKQQPYREHVEVHIERGGRRGRRGPYGYGSLTGEALRARVVVRYGRARVYAALRYVPELKFPLMYVERVEEC